MTETETEIENVKSHFEKNTKYKLNDTERYLQYVYANLQFQLHYANCH